MLYTKLLPKEEILALGLSESYADLHGFFSKAKEKHKAFAWQLITL